MDGTLFYPVDLPENELELFVIQNAPHMFGPATLYIPKKKLVGAHIKKVTDGLLLDLTNPHDPSFWIVEVELGTHDPDHIESQVSGFIRSLKKLKTLRELVKVVYDYVEKSKASPADWYTNSFVPAFTHAEGDQHAFIDALIHKKRGVMIVTDGLNPKHAEVISDLRERSPVRVIEFKTYWKQGQLIHTFSQPDLSQSD